MATTEKRGTRSHPTATKKSRVTIGVLSGWQVYNMAFQEFFGPLFRGIRNTARQNNADVLIGCGLLRSYTASNQVFAEAGWLLPPDDSFVPIVPDNVDGLIVVNPLHSDARRDYLQKLTAEKFPIVHIGHGDFGWRVAANDRAGIREAVRHLVEQGHRAIAFAAGEFSPQQHTDSSYRLAGYRAAVQEFGLSTDPRLIVYGFNIEEGGRKAAHQLVNSGVPFTAVVCSSDETAWGMICGLQEAGRRVPEDVAVTGFDDMMLARSRFPRLTTIHYPIHDAGIMAVEYLLRQIDGTIKENARTIWLPTRLIVRESCGNKGDTSTAVRRDSDGRQGNTPSMGSREYLAGIITDAVLKGGPQLASDDVRALAYHLAGAFIASLTTQNETMWLKAVQELLGMIERAGDTALPWQAALQILHADHAVVRTTSHPFRDTLLGRASMLISQHLDRCAFLARVKHNADSGTISLFTSKLHAAHDEPEIIKLASQGLEALGIHQTHIFYFESDGQDPVAWSVLHRPDADAEVFPTREFPPPSLYRQQPCQYILIPLTVGGQRTGYVVFDADNLEHCGAIVQHIGTALHSARLYRTAELNRRRAEDADSAKSRFLSTFSHELRSPLAGIVGLSEMLLTGHHLHESTYEDVQLIHANAQHLIHLITDMLDLSSSQLGQLRLNCEWLDPQSIFAPTLATGAVLAAQKGLNWRTQIAPALPPIYGDATRLRQVVLNLITNAIKFTEHGQVMVSAYTENDQLLFQVQDTGLGVPIEDQARIFEEFQQSERSLQGKYTGVGIGLAISKRIIDLHGGQLGVASDGVYGGGSTFTFALPVAQTLPESTPADARMPQTRRLNREAHTFLIVDDDAEILEMHTRMIEAHLPEARIVPARSGVEALRILQRQAIDLILLDLKMGEMHGFDVLRALQADPNLSDIPVIVLTAQILSDEEMKLLSDQNVTMVIGKGLLSAEELLQRITATLEGDVPHLRNEQTRLVRAAMAYIHTHYAEDLTRAEIASHVAVSQDHLNRCFQQEMGLSIMVYLTRYRIGRAKQLLATGRYSISEVAEAVGFSTSAYFCRVFRREVGVSPGSYQPVAVF
jgi:signal transduction histidine kinase/AraC-like DNA-binding protein/ABC-type sugar transport system substrate-binding protein